MIHNNTGTHSSYIFENLTNKLRLVIWTFGLKLQSFCAHVSRDTGKQSCASLSSVEFALSLILREKPGLPTSWAPLPAVLQYELCPRLHLQRIWKADPAATRAVDRFLMRLSQGAPCFPWKHCESLSKLLQGLECAATASLGCVCQSS